MPSPVGVAFDELAIQPGPTGALMWQAVQPLETVSAWPLAALPFGSEANSWASAAEGDGPLEVPAGAVGEASAAIWGAFAALAHAGKPEEEGTKVEAKKATIASASTTF